MDGMGKGEKSQFGRACKRARGAIDAREALACVVCGQGSDRKWLFMASPPEGSRRGIQKWKSSRPSRRARRAREQSESSHGSESEGGFSSGLLTCECSFCKTLSSKGYSFCGSTELRAWTPASKLIFAANRIENRQRTEGR